MFSSFAKLNLAETMKEKNVKKTDLRNNLILSLQHLKRQRGEVKRAVIILPPVDSLEATNDFT